MKDDYCSCERMNCFANKGGSCIALKDNKFKNGKPCPFFKTQEEIDAQEAKRTEKDGDHNEDSRS